MAFTKVFAILALTVGPQCIAFVPSSVRRAPLVVQNAGGFEWEDPTEAFDQDVDNPYKNPGLMNSEEGFKIDPARLLGPRLNGANLYLIGMMGSGKSSVGDIVARRKYEMARQLHYIRLIHGIL
jgi:hypothetical protein